MPAWLSSNWLVNTIVSDGYHDELGDDSLKKFQKQNHWSLPGYANLLTSKTAGSGDMHYPLFDIDMQMWYQKSSNGNWHIGFPVKMTFEAYMEILEVLAKHGIVQKGYSNATRQRGYGSVRLPGLIKGTPDDYYLTRKPVDPNSDG